MSKCIICGNEQKVNTTYTLTHFKPDRSDLGWYCETCYALLKDNGKSMIENWQRLTAMLLSIKNKEDLLKIIENIKTTEVGCV